MNRFIHSLVLSLLAVTAVVASDPPVRIRKVPDAAIPTQPPPGPPQVDVAEANRRGNMVVVTGEGARADEDDSFIQAMAPPPDDSHQWVFVLWHSDTCKACETLKADLRTKPELMGFVAAQQPAVPWSRLIEYNIADGSQVDRREKYKVSAVPTIVVQPPINGTWGKPSTVVFYQRGYDGNAAGLRDAIRAAVYRYAAVMGRRGFPTPAPDVKALGGEQPNEEPAAPIFPTESPVASATQSPAESSDVYAVGPLFAGGARQRTPPPALTPIAPQVDPFNPTGPFQPNPPPVQYPPVQYPPAPAPVTPPQPTGGLLDRLGGGVVLTIVLSLLVTAGTNAWMLYREKQKKAGVVLPISDQAAAAIIQALQLFVMRQPQQPGPVFPAPVVNQNPQPNPFPPLSPPA